jgi:DNA-binding transcriptional LysR family regulator
MNLQHLRLLRAVAETGSFSRAAEACHIGQPSLSAAVAQLERQLGGRLFERTTRRVSLTPFGNHILPLITGVLEAEREVHRAAQRWLKPAHRLIRVGFSPAVHLQPIQLALVAWQDEHPEAEVVFKECTREDLDRRLAEHSIDLALSVWLGGGKRESLVLTEEPLLLLPRQAAAAKPVGSGKLQELAGETFIFTRGCGLADLVGDLFRRARVPIRAYPGQALSYGVVEEWADLGLGAGVLPRSKVSGRASAAVPLRLKDGRPAMIQTHATWTAGGIDRKFLTWLRSRTSAIVAGMVAESAVS